ncbi:MAG: hypothetical protein LBU62_01100 [Bacteroidales bacterium]|jgi:hypothetical protein|nr:hypothetical protein [Bacteroidales bacterium]
MTDQERKEFLKAMEEFRLKLKGDKKLSNAFLIDVGIFTKDGKLAEPYQHLPSCFPEVKRESAVI